jgi:hypothetical protein
MTMRGKSLSFEAPEIEDLLHLEYGDSRTFPLGGRLASILV